MQVDALPRHVVESTVSVFFVSRWDRQPPGMVYSALNLSEGWWWTKCPVQVLLLCCLGSLGSSQVFCVIGKLRQRVEEFAMVLQKVPVRAEAGAQEILAPVPTAGREFFITAETSQRRTRSDIAHKEFPLCLQAKWTPECFTSCDSAPAGLGSLVQS